MMTKKEAGRLWCPMKRVDEYDALRHGGLAMACIVEKCAMWRWVGGAKEFVPRDVITWWPDEDYAEQEPPRPARVPAHAIWVPLVNLGEEAWDGGYWSEDPDKINAENDAAQAAHDADRQGYCGLAGRPA